MVRLALAVVLVGPKLLTATDESQAYWAAVSEFINGSPGKAMTLLRAISTEDVASILGATEKLAKAAGKCAQCEARSRFEVLPVRAALLLHARVDRLNRTESMGAGVDCTSSPHTFATERLAAVIAAQPAQAEFTSRVTTALALSSRAFLCPSMAERWAAFGLKTDLKSARLHLAMGLAHEMMGTLGIGPSADQAPRRGRQVDETERWAQDNRLHLVLARDSFGRALERAPDYAEAYLRLGRVQWRLGKLREAEVALDKAISLGRGEWLHLAHLYRGQILEDQNDLEGAIREYRSAVELDPLAQVSAVALAGALTIRGEMDQAREALGDLALSKHRDHQDPYWNYITGTTQLSEDLFETLRRESAR